MKVLRPYGAIGGNRGTPGLTHVRAFEYQAKTDLCADSPRIIYRRSAPGPFHIWRVGAVAPVGTHVDGPPECGGFDAAILWHLDAGGTAVVHTIKSEPFVRANPQWAQTEAVSPSARPAPSSDRSQWRGLPPAEHPRPRAAAPRPQRHNALHRPRPAWRGCRHRTWSDAETRP